MKWKKALIIIGIIFGIMLIIRFVNLSRKKNQPDEASTTMEVISQEPVSEEQTEGTTENPYKSEMGLNEKKGNADGRINIIVTEESTEEQHYVQENPTYPVSVEIFDKTDVPKVNMDGSSCKAYFNSVKLDSFGSYWGSSLTDADFYGANRYLVGVDQNPDDAEIGDLQSTGWLIDHLDGMNENDVIKFTNLHTIGSFSDSHVALLCSYDWYSAFGLDDTLVVFEDISGTLKAKKFTDGVIFSAVVYKHNIQVKEVNGKRVICVQYNIFV